MPSLVTMDRSGGRATGLIAASIEDLRDVLNASPQPLAPHDVFRSGTGNAVQRIVTSRDLSRELNMLIGHRFLDFAEGSVSDRWEFSRTGRSTSYAVTCSVAGAGSMGEMDRARLEFALDGIHVRQISTWALLAWERQAEVGVRDLAR